ncbi:MAG: TauD/TfdA family dioxygenase [Xanthomonadales bacterium]|nr:TauD/TfdA family dioxygenase [Xanthomonadales bacterium]
MLQSANNGSLQQLDAALIISPLQELGAVLLRGYASSLTEFQNFTETLCEDFHLVGTRRASDDQNSDGHTSEVPRSNFNLFAHSEGCYRPFPPPPELCFFNCVVPPACKGGETLLVDGVRFLQKLPADLHQRFEQQGVIYQALWDTQRWQSEFQVDRLEQLDELLLLHPRCSYRMHGDLMTVRLRMAATQNSLGNYPAFANGLLAHLPAITHSRWQKRHAYSKASNRIFFGDGEEISTKIINGLIDIQDEISRAHCWQADDLLILDNKRIMHGRCMTEGDCERQIRSRFGQLKREFKHPPGGVF